MNIFTVIKTKITESSEKSYGVLEKVETENNH